MVFAFLVDAITAFISYLGYIGVFLLMAAESMVLPVPSEAVMPFAGFLVATGRFAFWPIAFVSALGCLFGSLLSYAIGYYGATPLVKRYGKYVLLEEKHLEWMQSFFKRRGGLTVFVARFIPVVRHISSIPAGAGKMNLWTFSLYTFIGALLWNTFLLWLGFTLGEHWTLIKEYTLPLDIAVGVILLIGIGYLVHKLKAMRNTAQRSRR